MKSKKVIDRGKRSKTLSEVKPIENISKNAEYSEDKSRAKGSPSFTKIARPCVCVIESFRIKGR